MGIIVNGESFVKKLGDKELISLNPEYDNIPLTEDSKCMGRVVDKLWLNHFGVLIECIKKNRGAYKCQKVLRKKMLFKIKRKP